MCVFGPGAVVASLTIGTGELIFSTRGGALFGYRILFLFAIISLLKWGLVFATSRHMILTGVHPYRRMIDLPGPRGWLPIMLLLMAMVCLPVWIGFHSTVLGNLTSWITGTQNVLHGGMDYVWGTVILIAVLILSASGGYSILERVQLFLVAALVFCAGLTLVLYNPSWLELIYGLVPQQLAYPEWLPEKYPQIAEHSVWVETTRYVGVIGGAGFDYLAYITWLREKRWGVLPDKATPAQLALVAADPQHEVRKWIRAPLIDSAISFALVIAFCAVFVACGAIVLGSEQAVPDEDNFLSLQAKFVTRIHSLLFPLYVAGAFFAMLGTLYGTIEVACCIGDEIVRSFVRDWTPTRARNMKRTVLLWCGPLALLLLGWLGVRQAIPQVSHQPPSATIAAQGADSSNGHEPGEPARVSKPRLLLAILTPVNLFTGVLSCGLICILVIWMDARDLPRELQPPKWLIAMNVLSAVVFLGLGLKGFWDNENRVVVACVMVGILIASLALAVVLGPKLKSTRGEEPT